METARNFLKTSENSVSISKTTIWPFSEFQSANRQLGRWLDQLPLRGLEDFHGFRMLLKGFHNSSQRPKKGCSNREAPKIWGLSCMHHTFGLPVLLRQTHDAHAASYQRIASTPVAGLHFWTPSPSKDPVPMQPKFRCDHAAWVPLLLCRATAKTCHLQGPLSTRELHVWKQLIDRNLLRSNWFAICLWCLHNDMLC